MFSDGVGNSFTFRINTATNATTGGTASGTITTHTTGAVESAGFGAQPSIKSVTQGATPFDFGKADNARLVVTATSASAATASISINGTTFNTTNSGGATADLTSTGSKSIKVADAAGNVLEVAFNVTKAFANGDAANLDVSDLGRLVAADATTTGSTSFTFKVGTGTTANDDISFALGSITTATLGISGASIGTATNAGSAITSLNSAISTVASRRADVGAAESRLGFASDSIAVATENTTAAESAILDVDVSSEMTMFSSQQVLLQAGISLLAQANQQPSLLLKLLQ